MQRRAPVTSRTIVLVVLLALVAFVAWEARSTDLSTVDLAGHLSSAVHFEQGLFHRHEDVHFLGAIHGLFYPPIEDLLLGGMLALGRAVGATETGVFRVYLVVAAAAYLGSIAMLASKLRTRRGTLIFLGVVVIHFLMSNEPLLFQGMRLGDVVHMGLSSQFLGAAGFFALLAELWDRRRPWWIGAALTFTIGSHLVMGMVAVVVTLPSLARAAERKPILAALAGAGGMTAIFWAPFLAHGSYLLKNAALSGELPYGSLAALTVLLVVARRHPRVGTWALIPAALLFTAALANAAHWAHFKVPKFHFYRFEAIGVLVLGFVAAAYDEAQKPGPGERLARLIRPGYLVVAGVLFDVLRAGVYTPLPAPASIAGIDSALLEAPPYGRLVVLERGRSFGFGIESLITAAHPQLPVAKGLFWEAAPSNNVLSSDLALIGGPPSMLAHLEIEPRAHVDRCALTACMVDQYLADFNIRWLSYETRSAPNEWWGAQCFDSIVAARGTTRFSFEPASSFTFGERTFPIFRVTPAEGTSFTNEAVELVPPRAIEPLTGVRGREHEHYFFRLITACSPEQTSAAARVNLVSKADIARVPAGLREESSSKASLTRVSTGVFRLDAPRGTKALYRVKLNSLPGMVVEDEHGAPVPWLLGYPHMFVAAEGPTFIRFERTKPMFVGYGITAATALLLGIRAAFMWSKRRSR